jgi:2,3-bisphosphoglycerate-independent phosphoglycerate mutase
MIGRLLKAAEMTNTVLIITADHGNADDMFEGKEKDYPQWTPSQRELVIKPRTAHSLNPVPFYIYDPKTRRPSFRGSALKGAGLANIAATVLRVMGLPDNKDFLPSIIE